MFSGCSYCVKTRRKALFYFKVIFGFPYQRAMIHKIPFNRPYPLTSLLQYPSPSIMEKFNAHSLDQLRYLAIQINQYTVIPITELR